MTAVILMNWRMSVKGGKNKEEWISTSLRRELLTYEVLPEKQ